VYVNLSKDQLIKDDNSNLDNARARPVVHFSAVQLKTRNVSQITKGTLPSRTTEKALK